MTLKEQSLKKLVLGTVQLGLNYGVNNCQGKPSLDQSMAILDRAHELGITELDTASAYGNAEEVISQWHRTRQKVFRVFSKSLSLTSENLLDHVLSSVKTLSPAKIAGYYFHRPEELRHFKSLEILDEIKRRDLVLEWGVSLYSLEDLEWAVNTAQIDVIQLPYNLLDHSKEKKDLLARAQAQGKKIYARSVYLQGLFFMHSESLPLGLKPLGPLLNKIQDFAQKNGWTLEALALNFVLQAEGISKVLIGVESKEQLEANYHSILNRPVPQEFIDMIEGFVIQDSRLVNPALWSSL